MCSTGPNHNLWIEPQSKAACLELAATSLKPPQLLISSVPQWLCQLINTSINSKCAGYMSA